MREVRVDLVAPEREGGLAVGQEVTAALAAALSLCEGPVRRREAEGAARGEQRAAYDRAIVGVNDASDTSMLRPPTIAMPV
jgi:hypothetical protein